MEEEGGRRRRRGLWHLVEEKKKSFTLSLSLSLTSPTDRRFSFRPPGLGESPPPPDALPALFWSASLLGHLEASQQLTWRLARGLGGTLTSRLMASLSGLARG